MSFAGADAYLDRAARIGYPERVPVAVHDQGRHRVGQFPGPAAIRPARRVQRERESEHADRAQLGGRPAGDPGTAGPPADEKRSVRRYLLPHRRDQVTEGTVELTGGRGCPAAGDPVGLEDPRDGDTGGHGRIAYRAQVHGVHPATGTVPQDEQAERCGGGWTRSNRAGPYAVATSVITESVITEWSQPVRP